MKKITYILIVFIFGTSEKLLAFVREAKELHKEEWSTLLKIFVMLGSIISAFMACYAIWYYFLRYPLRKEKKEIKKWRNIIQRNYHIKVKPERMDKESLHNIIGIKNSDPCDGDNI